jgi:hypothetical protein
MNTDLITKHQELMAEKLKANPTGFQLDDDYICVVCQRIIRNKNGWYDKLGPKCKPCQKAVRNGIIPEIVCLKRNSWLAMWEVSQLGIHPMVIKKLMRRRKFKAKVVRDDKGKPYFYVFLLKENKFLIREYISGKSGALI